MQRSIPARRSSRGVNENLPPGICSATPEHCVDTPVQSLLFALQPVGLDRIDAAAPVEFFQLLRNCCLTGEDILQPGPINGLGRFRRLYPAKRGNLPGICVRKPPGGGGALAFQSSSLGLQPSCFGPEARGSKPCAGQLAAKIAQAPVISARCGVAQKAEQVDVAVRDGAGVASPVRRRAGCKKKRGQTRNRQRNTAHQTVGRVTPAGAPLISSTMASSIRRRFAMSRC